MTTTHDLRVSLRLLDMRLAEPCVRGLLRRELEAKRADLSSRMRLREAENLMEWATAHRAAADDCPMFEDCD